MIKTQPAPKPDPGPGPGPSPQPNPKPKPQPIKYVSSSTIKVPFAKAWLADETDVDCYLDSMRQALLDEIRKGKRIQV